MNDFSEEKTVDEDQDDNTNDDTVSANAVHRSAVNREGEGRSLALQGFKLGTKRQFARLVHSLNHRSPYTKIREIDFIERLNLRICRSRNHKVIGDIVT